MNECMHAHKNESLLLLMNDLVFGEGPVVTPPWFHVELLLLSSPVSSHLLNPTAALSNSIPSSAYNSNKYWDVKKHFLLLLHVLNQLSTDAIVFLMAES